MNKIVVWTICLSVGLSFSAHAQSPLLDKYRSMSLDYNHDIKAAEKNISSSMELEKSARADLKPKLSAGANFQYTGNPMELTLDIPSMGQPMTFQGKDLKYGASVSLVQPLYTGGRILETIRMAGLQQSVAVSQQEAIRSGVLYQTDIQYWNTVARHEITRVMADYRGSVSSLVGTIRERVEAGLTDPQDLLMAEVKLNEADYQLLQSTTDFETGRMAFNSLIGVDLQEKTEIEAAVPMVNASDSLLLSAGLERPEVKVARDRIQLAESALRLNDSQYKPQFSIGVDGSYSSPGYNFRSDLDPNYAVYAKVSVPIFEWGKRKSDKRAYQHKAGMATDYLNQTEDRVKLEIETARLSLVQALEQVQLTGNSLDKARENERKALERYHEGKVSIIEVIEAQTYRQTAQINFVRAKAASQAYYSGLIRALNVYSI